MILTTLLIGALIVGAIITFFVFGLAHVVPWLFVLATLAVVAISRLREKNKFLEWKDEYSVGIEVIDNDHRKLLNLINQFQTAVLYRTGQEFEEEAMSELVDYTRTHFKREEDLMKEHGYPGYEAHHAEHLKFIGEVEEMIRLYKDKGNRATLQQAVVFLRDWLINHIMGTDQAYSGFLIGKGVK